MPDYSIPLIANPAAGRGRAIARIARMRRVLDEAGIGTELIESTATGDIERIARELAAGGKPRILVAGGDGSVHEAVNGLVAHDGATPALGVLPAGTGNDFAKACGIPLRVEEAARQLADRLTNRAAPRQVDLGRMNGRLFTNSAGIGFDAKINALARDNRLPIGQLNYLVAVFQGVYDGVIMPRCRLEYEDTTYDGPLTMAEICIGNTVGGMFRMAPDARNDDGRLELVYVGPVSRARIFALLPKLVQGRHLSAPEVESAQVRSVSLLADEPVPSHLDGEVQAPADSFQVGILPGALPVL